MERPLMFMDWQNQYHKMTILPKAIYRFNAETIKISMSFYAGIKKINPKIYKRSRIANVILSRKSDAGGIIILNFKLYYRAIITKTVWFCQRNKYKDK
jgi:hypothetical protein